MVLKKLFEKVKKLKKDEFLETDEEIDWQELKLRYPNTWIILERKTPNRKYEVKIPDERIKPLIEKNY